MKKSHPEAGFGEAARMSPICVVVHENGSGLVSSAIEGTPLQGIPEIFSLGRSVRRWKGLQSELWEALRAFVVPDFVWGGTHRVQLRTARLQSLPLKVSTL